MKISKIFILLFCIVVSASNAQTQKNKRRKAIVRNAFISSKTIHHIVSGKVTQTTSYCGGAAPSQEMMNECSQPRPYVGKKFFIRKGSLNSLKSEILLEFTTDAKGLFSIELAPGVYSIIQEDQVKELDLVKLKSSESLSVDTDCLKAWWPKPYYLIELKDKDITNLNFNFYHPCFNNSDIPCMQYNGPMPP